MPKAVSASEAQEQLSSLIGWAREHGDKVIVESHGEPRAVIIAFEEYERLRALEEKQRRQEALESLRRLQAEVSERNKDLTEEQIEELADRFVRDVIDDMVAEGKIRFAGER